MLLLFALMILRQGNTSSRLEGNRFILFELMLIYFKLLSPVGN